MHCAGSPGVVTIDDAGKKLPACKGVEEGGERRGGLCGEFLPAKMIFFSSSSSAEASFH